jgi:hypothetical protein
MGGARSAAVGAGADMGLARCAAGSRRHACAWADLGISAAPGRSPTTVRTRTELGSTRACIFFAAAGSSGAIGCPCVGRVRRAGTGSSTGAGAGLERASGCSRAIVGGAARLTSITHPDGAVVEPSGSGLERTGAASLNAGRALFHRLGCASARVRGTATDCRSGVERTRVRGVGRPED